MDPYFDLLKAYFRPLGKLSSTVPVKILLSIGSAVIGTLILVLFFSLFVATRTMMQILPVFFGFNGAMAGFSLISRTGDRLPYKLVCAACSGVITVLIAWLCLSFLPDFSTPVRGARFALYCLTGFGAGGFGGWLAVKNHNLKKEG